MPTPTDEQVQELVMQVETDMRLGLNMSEFIAEEQEQVHAALTELLALRLRVGAMTEALRVAAWHLNHHHTECAEDAHRTAPIAALLAQGEQEAQGG